MNKIRVDNLAKLSVLVHLQQGPRHGYELIKETRRTTGKTISPGTIYPFLRLLAKESLVSVGRPGEREKTDYRLTPKGRRLVSDLLEQFGALVAAAIQPRLTSCAHCGAKVYAGAFTKNVKGKTLSFCCRYCAADYKG